jgi:hypothetical protein
MNANKGTFSVGNEASVLHGDHHIVTYGKLGAGLTNLKEGTVLKENVGTGVYTPAAPEDAAAPVTIDGGVISVAGAFAVLNEPVDDSDETGAAAIVVHGAVRREKIVYAGGDPMDHAGIGALRASGVYAAAGYPAVEYRDTIEELRNRIRQSTEILAAQSLGGSISYPMQNETGAAGSYDIDYGAIKTLPDIDISAMNYGQLRAALEKLYVEQQNTGYAGAVRFLVGIDAYSAIINLVIQKSAIPARFENDGLVIEGKYHLLPIGYTYKTPGAAEAAPVIDPKYIQTIDLNAPHTLFYAAIDDLEANLAPMPFFAKYKLTDDPSGVKIIAYSKPVPAPAVKAMVRQRVLPAA